MTHPVQSAASVSQQSHVSHHPPADRRCRGVTLEGYRRRNAPPPGLSPFVISRGGFLGLFESEVLVPLENVAVQGDRIVLRNMTEEQIKTSPKFENDDKAYRELYGTTAISLTEIK
jgi:hypothetical protein